MSKPLFIRALHEEIDYRSIFKLVNPPINISIVTHLQKGTHHIYPDNIGFACIDFYFINTEKPVQWHFPQRTTQIAQSVGGKFGRKTVLDTSERDQEFERLVSQFTGE